MNPYRCLLPALLLGLPLSLAAAPGWFKPAAPTLLPADQAFVPEPVTWRGGELRVPIRVTPGHYLYRHRFEVTPIEGPPQLPDGEAHQDEFFGEVEIYRQDVTLRWVVDPPPAQITLRYQGCADIGVCYPVQTRTLSVEVLP